MTEDEVARARMHQHAHAAVPSRRRPLVAALACAALVVSFLFLVPLPGSLVRAEEPSVTMVRRWKPTPGPSAPSTSIVGGSYLWADPAARVLFSYTNEGGFVAAYDLDTLQRRGTHLSVTGTRTAALADTVSGSLFLATSNALTGATRIEQLVSRPEGVVAAGGLDVTTMLGPGQKILGLYRAPDRPVLWVYAARATVPTTGVVDIAVAEFGIPGNSISRGVLRWSKSLPGCQVAMHGTEPVPVGIGYVPGQRALYFGCGNATVASFKNAPAARGVGRVVLTENAAGTVTPGELELFPTPGTFNSADTFFDPVSGRILITTYTSSQGCTITFFDTATNTYIGSFAAGGTPLQEAALDPVHGRFYGISAEAALGLVVTDVRATPVRQGYVFPHVGRMDGQGPTPHFIVVDPATSRFIVKYASVDDFVVWRDDVPKYAEPPGDDPDRNTVDVAERPGRTSAVYSGAAQGYGSRQRQVGGIEGLQVNVVGPISNVPYPVARGTREIRTSYLDALGMANQEAGAAAITADRDEGSEADASSSPQGDPWPYQPAHCVDFGAEATTSKEDGSEAECDAGNSRASARSTFDDSDASDVLIGHTELSAVARRDPVRGVVSRVESSASGIDVLGGLLHVGEVTATAEAWAKGRPGTNGTTYQRTVRDVLVQGRKLCQDDCDTDELAQQVNSLLAGRVRVEFPEPDPGYAAGSDGGYQALVRRTVAEQVEEQALNGQPPDRLEVPAMIVTMYQDDTKPGRTVVELAATEAEARYGITLLSDDDFGGEGGGGGGSSLDDIGGLGPLADDAPAFGVFPEDTVPGASLPGGRLRPATGLGEPISSVGGLLWNGLGRILDLLPVWAVLLTPIYLSARRWLLLQRGTLARGGTP